MYSESKTINQDNTGQFLEGEANIAITTYWAKSIDVTFSVPGETKKILMELGDSIILNPLGVKFQAVFNKFENGIATFTVNKIYS